MTRRRKRLLELAGLGIGLAVGLCLALGWLVLFPRGATPQAPQRASTAPPPVIRQAASGPDPAFLDNEWAALSDRSGCADWAGGDGISAVRLSKSQIAWFFSDTYLGPAGPGIGFSRSSGFLHNSVVVQTMTGAGSTFVTLTGGGACTVPGRPTGPPAAVVAPPQVPGGPGDRYWAEDGMLSGGAVVKFYVHYLSGGVPFLPAGTVIAVYQARALAAAGHGARYGAVARPSLIVLPPYVPPGAATPVVWGASLLRAGETVYVYGTQGSALYLARVRADRLAQFAAWQFWDGGGWSGAQRAARPVPAAPASSGFSVVRAGGRYWLIQADGGQDIDAQQAGAPWGPFGGTVVLYHDSGIGLDAAHDYRIMYEARAEPAVSTGGWLVISYNVNSEAVSTGCEPLSTLTNTVTLPRFIAVPLARFPPAAGAAAGVRPSAAGVRPSAAAGVRAAAAGYPSIVARDPSQWFNGWNYPGGCPPVPGVSSAQARVAGATAVLSWTDAGLGVHYRVYLLAPGAAGYALAAAPYAPRATLRGLAPGTYTVRVVPVNFRLQSGAAAQVMFTVTR